MTCRLRTSCVTPRRYQPWKGRFFAQSWVSARARRGSRVHRHQQKSVLGRTGCGSLSLAARDSSSGVFLLALPAANNLALPEINANCSCTETGVSPIRLYACQAFHTQEHMGHPIALCALQNVTGACRRGRQHRGHHSFELDPHHSGRSE